MPNIYPSQPYRPGCMGSLGNASYMLLRQFQFPDSSYAEEDQHITRDSDRLDYNKSQKVFSRHTGSNDSSFQNWLGRASDQQVFALIADLLVEFDPSVKEVPWTGYRVMGSVHMRNGHPVFHLALFWKNPDSETKVSDANPCRGGW